MRLRRSRNVSNYSTAFCVATMVPDNRLKADELLASSPKYNQYKNFDFLINPKNFSAQLYWLQSCARRDGRDVSSSFHAIVPSGGYFVTLPMSRTSGHCRIIFKNKYIRFIKNILFYWKIFDLSTKYLWVVVENILYIIFIYFISFTVMYDALNTNSAFNDHAK